MTNKSGLFLFIFTVKKYGLRLHFIQHVPFEHPAYLLKWAEKKNYTHSITKVYESHVFPFTETFDILVIMGGPMGAYEEDKYEWLKFEKQFIKEAIIAGKKVWGICLGCQLIADILGAGVYPHKQKEIGWWPVKKTKDHPLTKALPDEFVTFHWHGDTYDLPADAIRLFESEACAQQGFLYKNNVAGVQFHPEVEEDLLNSLTIHDRAELVSAKYIQTEDEMKKLLPLHIAAQHTYITSLMEGFLSI
jgi:GMP synthase-like glutamine amidotransferase